MKCLLLWALLLTIVSVVLCDDQNSLFVKFIIKTTTLGKIIGTKNKYKGVTYYRYLGIPYGKAKRFKKPKAYGRFKDDPFNATEFGSPCPQWLSGQPYGSDDCQSLSIFAPRRKRGDELKSVMIWLYGGNFGSGRIDLYPLDVLASYNDVVGVAINYRINAFGFLASKEDGLVGNYGLWDQQLAIKWVKDNIEEYGGDPESITLFGESAGGASILYHMSSPTTPEGLFHRGITQSGSAFSLRFQTFNSIANFKFINSYFGCNNVTDSLSCLQAVPTGAMSEAARGLNYYPTVDKDFISDFLAIRIRFFGQESYLPQSPFGLGQFANYDILSGWNTMEGLVYTPTLEQVNIDMTGNDLSQGVSEEVLKEALNVLTRGSFSEGGDIILNVAIQFYMNNPNPMISDGRTIADRRVEAFVDLMGDVAANVPTITHLQMHSRISGKSTYAFEFKYKPPGPGAFGPEKPEWLVVAANHADEILFVMGAPLAPPFLCPDEVPNRCGFYTKQEKRLSRRIMEYWTNFAKTGNPGGKFIPFQFPGNQSYTIIDLGADTNHVYPRSAAHRFSAIIDEVAIDALNP